MSRPIILIYFVIKFWIQMTFAEDLNHFLQSLLNYLQPSPHSFLYQFKSFITLFTHFLFCCFNYGDIFLDWNLIHYWTLTLFHSLNFFGFYQVIYFHQIDLFRVHYYQIRFDHSIPLNDNQIALAITVVFHMEHSKNLRKYFILSINLFLFIIVLIVLISMNFQTQIYILSFNSSHLNIAYLIFHLHCFHLASNHPLL